MCDGGIQRRRTATRISIDGICSNVRYTACKYEYRGIISPCGGKSGEKMATPKRVSDEENAMLPNNVVGFSPKMKAVLANSQEMHLLYRNESYLLIYVHPYNHNKARAGQSSGFDNNVNKQWVQIYTKCIRCQPDPPLQWTSYRQRTRAAGGRRPSPHAA